ncbi:MAG: Penicillinase repressor [Gemmatimonadetes bacterium]|nr:Penicillinase repressor [Gemmatimonadota bacterium]
MVEAQFTDRELDVMAVLWELGSATVPEARVRIADDLAYTTVQTVLRTLVSKGFVKTEEEGRFHRYFPLVARDEASQSALRRLLAKLCGGSPELLLSQLVAQGGVSTDHIRRMRNLLDLHLPEENR